MAQAAAVTALRGGARQPPAVRVLVYAATRLVALFAAVVVGVYLTILVANMGGYVDQIKRAEIREQVALAISLNEQMRRLPADVRERVAEEMIRNEERRLGLDRPFLSRSVGYLRDALLLRLGFAERMTSDTGSRLVRQIILDRLPATLLLFLSAQLVLFFASVAAALALSRRYGSPADRLVVALAPTSAAPAWFYGIFLILVFAAGLRWLPFGGMVDAPPPESKLAYAASVLKHMVLPLASLALSSIFLSVYAWRTFFLIFSSEDYVELARAKGLPGRLVERRYILRPALPTILTSFALGLIGAWTGAIVLETVFNWPGLGRALYQAVGLYDTPVIVGTTILYAYLLAVTVFALDIVYAVVDPRVKVGLGGER
ncbi:MAG: ABC transporter permease [Firmicutes bacterium]|nr:ABC transporter permease [Bacillota bacterium]